MVSSQHLLRDLLGASDSHFRVLQESFPLVQMVARGANVSLRGPSEEVGLAESVVKELLLLVQEGTSLDGRVGSVVQMVREELPDPAGVLSQTLSLGRGRLVRVKTHRQLRYVQSIRESTATFAVGPAGTGKTYLAMAAAVEALVQGNCRRIVLTRPAVEAGERLGFLPGDLTAKVDPYLRPLYDALWDMLGHDETARLIERGTIEIAPLAYMRGRTLNDACVILDEAQNTSPEQMKMFLTRLGFNSKMIITGDSHPDRPTFGTIIRSERGPPDPPRHSGSGVRGTYQPGRGASPGGCRHYRCLSTLRGCRLLGRPAGFEKRELCTPKVMALPHGGISRWSADWCWCLRWYWPGQS